MICRCKAADAQHGLEKELPCTGGSPSSAPIKGGGAPTEVCALGPAKRVQRAPQTGGQNAIVLERESMQVEPSFSVPFAKGDISEKVMITSRD